MAAHDLCRGMQACRRACWNEASLRLVYDDRLKPFFMLVSRLSVLVPAGIVALLLWGCSQTPQFQAQHEPWRELEERACLVSGQVREQPWLMSRSALGGPSVCGALKPFEMLAVSDGRVQMKPDRKSVV